MSESVATAQEGELQEAAEAGVGTTGDPVVDEAKRFHQRCSEWESNFRHRFIEDLKFSYGDSDNGYQWPNAIRRSRDVEAKPCLTMNIIRQHNLQIINDFKRNKAEAQVVPVGGGASFESATMMKALLEHIQYQSKAASIAYSVAREFQVYGGIGYWRLVTDWVEGEFYQEIKLLPINDPLTVFLDPDIKQRDGSDAKKGLIFDNVPRAAFREAYPEFADLVGTQPLGSAGDDSEWITREHVRICEYFRKVLVKDELFNFLDPSSGQRKNILRSDLPANMRDAIASDPMTRRRACNREVIEWYLIAGDRVIDRTIWPGKFIPIVRVVGEETVVEGLLDRKGHTRAMKDAQRMLNYNSSGQVEHVALQTKAPWTGAAEAIEDYEQMWGSANTANHSFLPFKHRDSDGEPLPLQALPRRVDPPTAAPAFEAGMATAFNQIMMVSGQWQNQMGMMGNERTGEAIERRQDQGDTATYHFRDNFELALVFTAQQIVDLVPRIYDTRRVLQIQADDGSIMELAIDPAARAAYQQKTLVDGAIAGRVLNPTVGQYEVRAAPGAAFGTRRQETVQALTLILTQAPALTGVIGDLLLSSMDFDKAQEAARRLRRMVPPQALGQGPTQQEQQLQQQNAQLMVALREALQKLGKEQLKLVGKDQMRDIDAYKAETDRFKALTDVLLLDQGGVQQVVEQLVQEAAQTHLTPILQANAGGVEDQSGGGDQPEPPMPGAQRAPDGEWYLRDPTRMRGFMRLAPLAQQHSTPEITANA